MTFTKEEDYIKEQILQQREKRFKKLIYFVTITFFIVLSVVAFSVKTYKTQEKKTLKTCDVLSQMYDYDTAINTLQEFPLYKRNKEMQKKVEEYTTQKEVCKSFPLSEIPHIFFHSMIKDPTKAFDGDADTDGYNQVMTTLDEFAAMMSSMYDNGYVLVSLHDICTINEDGSVTPGNILLPEGKKPFVLSQDDLSYYHYMDGDGFAQKLVIDPKDGKVKCSYIEYDANGTAKEVLGNFDMVPWIDSFVEEHPDFSYRGAKGTIALTGYEGILGYRTDEVYLTKDDSRLTNSQKEFFIKNPDFDEKAWKQEVKNATAVASAMKENGWEFASHTWGHISPEAKGLDWTKIDTERWQNNVASIVGSTDILIFAFGADIGNWTPYTSENELFTYFKEQGFSIFCNVDASQNWMQFGDNYMRQSRINLDGYRMYQELLNGTNRYSDFFAIEDVWDFSRPLPVPDM